MERGFAIVNTQKRGNVCLCLIVLLRDLSNTELEWDIIPQYCIFSLLYKTIQNTRQITTRYNTIFYNIILYDRIRHVYFWFQKYMYTLLSLHDWFMPTINKVSVPWPGFGIKQMFLFLSFFQQSFLSKNVSSPITLFVLSVLSYRIPWTDA